MLSDNDTTAPNLRDRNIINKPTRNILSIEKSQCRFISDLKRKRAGNKSSITKRIYQIQELISNKGSRTKVKAFHLLLFQTRTEAFPLHELLMSLLHDEDEEYNDEWIEETDYRINTCRVNLEA